LLLSQPKLALRDPILGLAHRITALLAGPALAILVHRVMVGFIVLLWWW
jgi:hypothetical protein